jgi:MSHA biogenesis protein MshL
MNAHRPAVLLLAALLLSSCAPPPRPDGVDPAVLAQVKEAPGRRVAPPPAVNEALLPRPQVEMPALQGRPLEPRFDLSVNNAPAAQVFNSIVSGTRYSMLVHPGVTGTVSVNLKDVTIHEALDALRELYGYDFKVDGTRVFVQPAGLQTRVFQVNYLPGLRRGSTDVRVQSGAVTDAGAQGPVTPGALPATTTPPTSRSLESSRVTTQQQSDFWADLRASLTSIVGAGDGRSVVVSQSGVVVVRAFPNELRSVEQFLRATRLAVERQVMLEAKIVEVTLSDTYQSGINWAAFYRDKLSIGQVSRGTVLQPRRTSNLSATGAASITGGTPAAVTAPAFSAFAGEDLVNHTMANAGGSVFGLALATSNFAALLTFLETQGNVQVLSSPRIATLNNQKAVLKVGTDEFFVTNVTTTTTSSGTSTQQSPTVTVQPFFSGIVLDVTPQVDEVGNIMLHIHPSVSEVTESTRVVNLGGQIAEIRLPLAKSTVNETDTIVRVQDGNIVAIGGLMSVDIRDARGGLPGISEGGLGDLARSTDRSVRKKELVILLKPTVIESERAWERDLRETRQRLEGMGRGADGAATRGAGR